MELTLAFKSALIDYCFKHQEEAIQTARKAMLDAQTEANNYGAPKDRYDGFRNQQLRRRDLHARQLEHAMANLKLLENIDANQTIKKVGLGALVQTDKAFFFIAIGLGLIHYDGDEIAVISTKVPIFQVMREKSIGDSFSFNNTDHKILMII